MRYRNLKTADYGGSVQTLEQDGLGHKTKLTDPAAAIDEYGYNSRRQITTETARSNSTFSWNETFGYDNLDRLTSFNDNNGNHSQQYDGRGRITENSRQGIYGYTGNSYQQQELDLNPTADTYYQTRQLQNISYNAFKSPVEIHEPGLHRGYVLFLS